MYTKTEQLAVNIGNRDLAILESIVEYLEHFNGELTGIDIKRGRLGLSLFYLLYGDYTQDEQYYLKAVELITESVSALGNGYQSFNINLELSEMGRYLEFIQKEYGIDFEEQELFRFIDEIQSAELERTIAKGDCDPYTGCLVGGYYFLARCKTDPSLKTKVEDVIHTVSRSAEKDLSGNLYWVSQLHKKHEIFLGLSHGNSSIILFLNQAYLQGILPELCLSIMKRAAGYILANAYNEQEKDQLKSMYPTIVGENESSPLCWCYGDLGVALALHKVAALSEPGGDKALLINEVGKVLEFGAKRKNYQETRIGDAGICYGASGTFLMFNYLSQFESFEQYSVIAEEWYAQIPGFAVHPEYPCGFKGMFNQQYANTNHSFNEGIIGIGCTILSKLNNNYSALNEFLNIS